MAHQTFQLEGTVQVPPSANTEIFRLISYTWDTDSPSGRPRVSDGLAGSGIIRYLSFFSIFAPVSGQYAIQLSVANVVSGTDVANQDLTAQFEGNWEMGIQLGDEFWVFKHDDFLADTAETYTWRATVESVQQELLDVFNAWNQSAHDLELTLWDGAGSTPFTKVTAEAGPTHVVVGSGDTVTLGGVDTIANGSGPTIITWSRTSATGGGQTGSMSSTSVASPIFTAPVLPPGALDTFETWVKVVTNNGVTAEDTVNIRVTLNPPLSNSVNFDLGLDGALDVDPPNTQTWRVELDGDWYSDRSPTLRLWELGTSFASVRPQAPYFLLASPTDNAYLSAVVLREDTDRFILHFETRRTGGAFSTNADLSDQIQSGIVALEAGGETWEFDVANDAASADSAEPYVWTLAPSKVAAFEAFRDSLASSAQDAVLRITVAASDLTLTIGEVTVEQLGNDDNLFILTCPFPGGHGFGAHSVPVAEAGEWRVGGYLKR